MYNMLVKCNYLNKLHLCTSSQDRWADSGITSKQWSDLLTEAIFVCIPEDPKLRDLFLRWCPLSRNDRKSIDEKTHTREGFDLYLPLKRAMVCWERLQDLNGAPGVESGMFGFTCDSRLEEELTNLVSRVDTIIGISFENNHTSEKAIDLLDDQSTSELKQLA